MSWVPIIVLLECWGMSELTKSIEFLSEATTIGQCQQVQQVSAICWSQQTTNTTKARADLQYVMVGEEGQVYFPSLSLSLSLLFLSCSLLFCSTWQSCSLSSWSLSRPSHPDAWSLAPCSNLRLSQCEGPGLESLLLSSPADLDWPPLPWLSTLRFHVPGHEGEFSLQQGRCLFWLCWGKGLSISGLLGKREPIIIFAVSRSSWAEGFWLGIVSGGMACGDSLLSSGPQCPHGEWGGSLAEFGWSALDGKDGHNWSLTMSKIFTDINSNDGTYSPRLRGWCRFRRSSGRLLHGLGYARLVGFSNRSMVRVVSILSLPTCLIQSGRGMLSIVTFGKLSGWLAFGCAGAIMPLLTFKRWDWGAEGGLAPWPAGQRSWPGPVGVKVLVGLSTFIEMWPDLWSVWIAQIDSCFLRLAWYALTRILRSPCSSSSKRSSTVTRE